MEWDWKRDGLLKESLRAGEFRGGKRKSTGCKGKTGKNGQEERKGNSVSLTLSGGSPHLLSSSSTVEFIFLPPLQMLSVSKFLGDLSFLCFALVRVSSSLRQLDVHNRVGECEFGRRSRGWILSTLGSSCFGGGNEHKHTRLANGEGRIWRKRVFPSCDRRERERRRGVKHAGNGKALHDISHQRVGLIESLRGVCSRLLNWLNILRWCASKTKRARERKSKIYDKETRDEATGEEWEWITEKRIFGN